MIQYDNEFLSSIFPYALGYWQGRACGNFENGSYESFSEDGKNLYKIGYDSGIADYCELDADNYLEVENV
jgi:hypothetical protein